MKLKDIATVDYADIKKAQEVCRKCYLSCMMLRGANNGQYFQLKIDLLNGMTKGTNNFPKTIVETMRLLTNYVPQPRLQRSCDPDGKGLAFIQGKGGALRGTKRDSANKEIKCWHCGGLHYKSECSELKLLDMGVQNINININNCDEEHNLFSADNSYGLVQKQTKGVRGIISPYHAYINTCTSYSSIPYPELLSNLKKQACELISHSNAGSCGMDSSGLLGDLEQVWLNKGGVARIIPLKQLKKLCPLVYDSTRNRGVFICCTKVGNVVFKSNDKGMPYLDLREFEAKAVLSFAPKAALSFVQTVQGNMEGFTWRKVEEA